MIEIIRKHLYMTIVILNITAWTLMTVADALDEYRVPGASYSALVVFGIPILMCVFFIVAEAYGLGKGMSTKQKVVIIVVWFACGFIFSVFIGARINDNIWIVKQHRRGWENFLNGFEYMMLGVFWTAGCPIVFTIVYVIEWLINKYHTI